MDGVEKNPRIRFPSTTIKGEFDKKLVRLCRFQLLDKVLLDLIMKVRAEKNFWKKKIVHEYLSTLVLKVLNN